MKKTSVYTVILVAILLMAFVVVQLLNCKVEAKENRTNGEVVLVDSALIASHPWSEASFDITCVDSLDDEHEDGYYWFIYDSPDQFETVLCVSTNKETYEKLQKLLHRMKQSNWAYSEYLESKVDRFHLYYGQCEETILIYE